MSLNFFFVAGKRLPFLQDNVPDLTCQFYQYPKPHPERPGFFISFQPWDLYSLPFLPLQREKSGAKDEKEGGEGISYLKKCKIIMNRLLTYPLLIWEFIGYMSIFTKQKQTSDLLPPAIGKLSIGPKSACPSSFPSSSFSSTFSGWGTLDLQTPDLWYGGSS